MRGSDGFMSKAQFDRSQLPGARNDGVNHRPGFSCLFPVLRGCVQFENSSTLELPRGKSSSISTRRIWDWRRTVLGVTAVSWGAYPPRCCRSVRPHRLRNIAETCSSCRQRRRVHTSRGFLDDARAREREGDDRLSQEYGRYCSKLRKLA